MAHDSTTQLQAWIEHMNAGDAAARDELIRHACDRLRRLTRKMLGDFSGVRPFEETDDVLQNAVMRLLRAMESVPVASVAEFFRLATRHIRWELLDMARKYRDQVSPGSGPLQAGREAGSDHVTPAQADPGTTTFDAARLAHWTEFHETVEKLPDEERQAFELLWYQGLTREEAAAALGISAATIGRRWLAARLKLAAYLRRNEVEPSASQGP